MYFQTAHDKYKVIPAINKYHIRNRGHTRQTWHEETKRSYPTGKKWEEFRASCLIPARSLQAGGEHLLSTRSGRDGHVPRLWVPPVVSPRAPKKGLLSRGCWELSRLAVKPYGAVPALPHAALRGPAMQEQPLLYMASGSTPKCSSLTAHPLAASRLPHAHRGRSPLHPMQR